MRIKEKHNTLAVYAKFRSKVNLALNLDRGALYGGDSYVSYAQSDHFQSLSFDFVQRTADAH